MMLPVPLTSTTPSASFHLAAPPLSLRHFDRSLPSNRTRASDGGGPGSITFGSVSSIFSAATAKVTAHKQRNVARVRPVNRRCAEIRDSLFKNRRRLGVTNDFLRTFSMSSAMPAGTPAQEDVRVPGLDLRQARPFSGCEALYP